MLKVRKIVDACDENKRREYWGDVTSICINLFGDVLKSAYIFLGVVFEEEITNDIDTSCGEELVKFIIKEKELKLEERYESYLKYILDKFKDSKEMGMDEDNAIILIFKNGKIVSFSGLDYCELSELKEWED